MTERSLARDALSKVPAVTLVFWIIKVFATTLGETGGDAVSMSLNLGYLVGSAIFIAIFIAFVAGQVRADRFRPFLYWATIVATTTRDIEPIGSSHTAVPSPEARRTGGTTAAVTCERVSAGGVEGEWISPANAPLDKAVLYFHGGGFRIGSVASHRDLIARIARASGRRVLAINYRLAPQFKYPAAVEDVESAIRFVRQHAKRYKVDPNRIALIGESAGGHLALMAAFRSDIALLE